ncbi:MAG: thioredoxin [bacterium]
MAVKLNSSNFEAEVEKSAKPVVIDVFAEWCGPCQMMGPIFEEVEKELIEKYKFAKFNIDEERDLAIKFGVSSIPTFLFFKNAKIVGKEVGYMSKDILQSKVESLLG